MKTTPQTAEVGAEAIAQCLAEGRRRSCIIGKSIPLVRRRAFFFYVCLMSPFPIVAGDVHHASPSDELRKFETNFSAAHVF
jgi:hypothetical protein